MPNNLTLRSLTSPYNDITKGSVLSFADLDNNMIFLKGLAIKSANVLGAKVVLTRYDNSTLTLDVTSLSGGTSYAPITGGTYDNQTGTLTLIDLSGDTISITGFSTTSLKWYSEYSGSPSVSPIVGNAGSIAIGDGAQALGNDMFVYGNNAGQNATYANQSIFIGDYAGVNATYASYSNFLGNEAGFNATNAFYSNFLGQGAGYDATSASYSNFLGYVAGNQATNAFNSNFIGVEAGIYAANANDSNFLGYQAGSSATSGYYSNFFGNSAGNGAVSAHDSNFFGQNAGNSAINAFYSNFFGNDAGFQAIYASGSNFLGTSSGYGITGTGVNGFFGSNFIGPSAGLYAHNAYNSNFFGDSAGGYLEFGATNAYNGNFFGFQTGLQATNANDSNFLGYQAGCFAINASNSNFFGHNAGYNASNASYSTLIGYQTAYNINNTNGIGSNNIIIGTNITLADDTANSLNIGGVLFGTGLYSNIGGEPYTGVSNANIGINVINPSNALHISAATDPIRIEGLQNNTDTSLLTIDTNGIVHTTTISGLTGNTINIYNSDGVLNSNRTIGLSSYKLTFTSSTTPNNLVFSGGNIGINVINPSNALHISAATDPIRIEGLQNNTDTSLLTIDTNGIVHTTTISGLTGNTINIYNSDGVLNSNRTIGLSSYKLTFTSSTTPNNLVFSGGNIGINNPTPQYQLDVSGNSNFYGAININQQSYNSGGDIFNIINYSNNTPLITLYNGYGGIRPHIYIGTTNLNWTGYTNGTNTDYGTIAIGRNVLQSLTTNGLYGFRGNTGIGYRAMNAVTTGQYNTGYGIWAMEYLTVGGNNTAIGNDAGGGLSTGFTNTFIGDQSGYYNNDIGFMNQVIAIGAGAQAAGSAISSITNTTIIGTAVYSLGSPFNVQPFYTKLNNVQILGTSTQNTIIGYPFQPNNQPDLGYRLQVLGNGIFTSGLTVTATTNPLKLVGLSANTGDTSYLTIDGNGIIHSNNIGSSSPAFSAWASIPNIIPGNGTPIKLSADTIEYNIGNAYNNSTFRFNPQIAGYYQINGYVSIASFTGSISTSAFICSIYKNGNEFKRGNRTPVSSAGVAIGVNHLIYLSGGTDYVEFWALQGSSVNQQTETNQAYGVLFNGTLVRGK